MSTAKLKTMAECIECGVGMFDERKPGWLAITNPSRLRTNSNIDDVLGQVFSGPGPGGAVLSGLAPDDWNESDEGVAAYFVAAVHHGIYASDGKVDGVTRFSDAQLTEAWRRRLIALKAERGVS